MGVGGQPHAPAALPHKIGGPQSLSGLCYRDVLPPHELKRRTVQPVASRFTEWAIVV